MLHLCFKYVDSNPTVRRQFADRTPFQGVGVYCSARHFTKKGNNYRPPHRKNQKKMVSMNPEKGSCKSSKDKSSLSMRSGPCLLQQKTTPEENGKRKRGGSDYENHRRPHD
ncbi:hypothetical protein MRB53_005787 [Persea americana]|uniref:Uncharacterized protein n=1 Tax=Persea americana TaxID=3435 RepID=A0ACC2MFA8_PERAE|nr:hypothetical protein MRB53_005787 [Persea americana]